MAFPIKVCAICGEEFELKPDKPGFANRCPDCTSEADDPVLARRKLAAGASADSELEEARKSAIRDLLYRKES